MGRQTCALSLSLALSSSPELTLVLTARASSSSCTDHHRTYKEAAPPASPPRPTHLFPTPSMAHFPRANLSPPATPQRTASPFISPHASSGRKPNILFILADQVSAPLLHIHNKDSPIKTPHIDQLATKSAVFSSAYCPSPLCAPARSSLVTGQLPSQIGAWDNAAPLGCDVPTYAHYLRREGYQTVLAGKMHFIGEQLHGFEERLTTDIYPGDLGWYVL